MSQDYSLVRYGCCCWRKFAMIKRPAYLEFVDMVMCSLGVQDNYSKLLEGSTKGVLTWQGWTSRELGVNKLLPNELNELDCNHKAGQRKTSASDAFGDLLSDSTPLLLVCYPRRIAVVAGSSPFSSFPFGGGGGKHLLRRAGSLPPPGKCNRRGGGECLHQANATGGGGG